MANQAKKNNKNLIIGVCIALIAIAIIAVVVVLVIKRINNAPSDSYFVTDETKFVINSKGEEYTTDDDEYQAKETHIVYYFSGDTITGMKTYYEYSDETKAKTAFNYFKNYFADEFKDIELDGKYVILTSDEADYANVTKYDIEQQMRFIESQSTTTDDISTEEETIVEESTTEAPVEEEIIVEETPAE